MYRFKYDVLYYSFDLDDLDNLSSHELYPFFGHNSWKPVSLFDRDYMGEDTSSNTSNSNSSIPKKTIKQKLFYHLEKRNMDTSNICRVQLVTVPR